MDSNDVLKRAIEAAGGVAKLARHFNIHSQAVSQWRRVPAARVREVEKLTGISRYELRPDIYGDPPEQEGAAA